MLNFIEMFCVLMEREGENGLPLSPYCPFIYALMQRTQNIEIRNLLNTILGLTDSPTCGILV
jgi:hypothetical protein